MTEDRWLRVKRLFEARSNSPRPNAPRSCRPQSRAMKRCAGCRSAARGRRRRRCPSRKWPVASESLLAELRTASSARRFGGLASPGLTAGDRLGNYAVVAPLGAGGMGEVYRAHDARLGRDVAIKILPHAFTTDPERLARFEREARVLAALNHPHIAGIYGIEEAGGAPALVLELVEGLTLADRITAGRILLEEALTIGRQIADALSAAHDKGIIHRDLKPANIKVTPSGVVKVLDFGLAKTDGEGATPELAHSPTITSDQTRDGIILGTAAYMSPEQARGKSWTSALISGRSAASSTRCSPATKHSIARPSPTRSRRSSSASRTGDCSRPRRRNRPPPVAAMSRKGRRADVFATSAMRVSSSTMPSVDSGADRFLEDSSISVESAGWLRSAESSRCRSR